MLSVFFARLSPRYNDLRIRSDSNFGNEVCYKIFGCNSKNGCLENADELTPIVEEYESASHHSEGDEAEHDVKPHHAYHQESPRAAQLPQRGFEINIADLFRTKMEKLEGRLQAVISTQLDRVEKKLIGWVGNGVGFDNVTDVSAAERKVNLPKKDPKLEEEVRVKNVGGKKLETELGFYDVRDVPTAERNVEALEEDPKLDEEVRGKNVRMKIWKRKLIWE
ncbi:Hypothetical predicted protein [Olea europaea subsp. europaea]|uniref:Uncharacterized protein n=1 Tax=Olea europaea subsp. europaea TaxID=158383 RepID=A0A8S0V5T8_OLEEU|nr:Hypothetical predicted protein [Olea europaea subsp. europaea]